MLLWLCTFFIFNPTMHYKDLHHFYSLMSVIINVMMCFYWAPIGLWPHDSAKTTDFIFTKAISPYLAIITKSILSFLWDLLNRFQFEFNHVLAWSWNLISTAKFSVIHAQNLWPHIACITVLECEFHKQLSEENICLVYLEFYHN